MLPAVPSKAIRCCCILNPVRKVVMMNSVIPHVPSVVLFYINDMELCLLSFVGPKILGV